jgi:uncharacterized protein
MSSSSLHLSLSLSSFLSMLSIPNNQKTLTVKVTPRSKKTEFVGLLDDGTLKIRLRAIPEDGQANHELLEYLE